MKNYCDFCDNHSICDTQISSTKLARYGNCGLKNAKLKKEYEGMNDDELIKVLEKEKVYPNMVWFIEANKVYRSRFSKDFE